jgi:hypothetical protein
MAKIIYQSQPDLQNAARTFSLKIISRLFTPTCGAASPTPPLAYISKNISFTSFRSSRCVSGLTTSFISSFSARSCSDVRYYRNSKDAHIDSVMYPRIWIFNYSKTRSHYFSRVSLPHTDETINTLGYLTCSSISPRQLIPRRQVRLMHCLLIPHALAP